MTGAEITITGNITADPVLRYTQTGVPVASFNVAHTPRRLNRSTNEWEDAGDTLFLPVNVWRELAENVAGSLRKGNAVVVIGRLGSRSYEASDGQKRTVVECEGDVVSVDLRRQTVSAVARIRKGDPAEEFLTRSTRSAVPAAALPAA